MRAVARAEQIHGEKCGSGCPQSRRAVEAADEQGEVGAADEAIAGHVGGLAGGIAAGGGVEAADESREIQTAVETPWLKSQSHIAAAVAVVALLSRRRCIARQLSPASPTPPPSEYAGSAVDTPVRLSL